MKERCSFVHPIFASCVSYRNGQNSRQLILIFLRVNQEVADLLPEANGTADQTRAEPHEELINSSQNSSIEEADVSSTSTGTMLSVSDNSLEEERTLFEDQVTQEAENLVVARYISAPSSSIADNSQSGQLSQKYVDKV